MKDGDFRGCRIGPYLCCVRFLNSRCPPIRVILETFGECHKIDQNHIQGIVVDPNHARILSLRAVGFSPAMVASRTSFGNYCMDPPTFAPLSCEVSGPIAHHQFRERRIRCRADLKVVSFSFPCGQFHLHRNRRSARHTRAKDREVIHGGTRAARLR